MDNLTEELKFLLEKNTTELNEITKRGLIKYEEIEVMERISCYQRNVLLNFLLYIEQVMGKGSAKEFLPVFIESIRRKLDDILYY